MSLLTESSARKHVTETRKRTPPAVFRPELQNMNHMRENREMLVKSCQDDFYAFINLKMEASDMGPECTETYVRTSVKSENSGILSHNEL